MRSTAPAAAIVIPPVPDADPLIPLNPRVISESAETDEQYEGCLSFFDVRGIVPRPLAGTIKSGWHATTPQRCWAFCTKASRP